MISSYPRICISYDVHFLKIDVSHFLLNIYWNTENELLIYGDLILYLNIWKLMMKSSISIVTHLNSMLSLKKIKASKTKWAFILCISYFYWVTYIDISSFLSFRTLIIYRNGNSRPYFWIWWHAKNKLWIIFRCSRLLAYWRPPYERFSCETEKLDIWCHEQAPSPWKRLVIRRRQILYWYGANFIDFPREYPDLKKGTIYDLCCVSSEEWAFRAYVTLLSLASLFSLIFSN